MKDPSGVVVVVLRDEERRKKYTTAIRHEVFTNGRPAR
jgi:hypothetical protein